MLDVQFDPTLGGRNFDAVIRESFNEEFKTKFRLDSRQNAKAWIRLGDEVEKLKKVFFVFSWIKNLLISEIFVFY